MVSEKKMLILYPGTYLKKKEKKILPTGPLCSLTPPPYLASNLVFM